MSVSDEGNNGVLPEGWAATILGEIVAEVQSGFACGTNNRGGDGVAHLRPMNVSTEGKIHLSDVKYIPAETVDNDRKWLRRGDVLFNNTNSTELVGKTAFYDDDEPRAFSNHMTRVRVREDALDARYCAAFLHHCWREGYFQGICNQHVSQSSVSRARLLDTPLDLPPLAEQRRIVSMVENLLERVNKARQRLDRVPKILKQFRQSVLAAACSGRLTADWREDGGDSDELPSTWETVEAGSLYIDARYGTSKKCSVKPVGIPVLRVPNIARGVMDLTSLKYTELPAHEREKLEVRSGDVIVCRTNGSLDLVGKAAVIPELPEPYAFASYLIRLRLDAASVVPSYFHTFLSGGLGRGQIEKRARSTAGQFNLNLEILRELELPLPPLYEQEEIVRRVAMMLAKVNAVTSFVASGATYLEVVGQSVLAKAFAGELVESEADLARREGRDYESAAVLLQRLVAGQSAASSCVRLERGRAVLDILLLLEAWNQPVSISALEPALVLMRNDAACQALLNRPATRRRRRSLSNEPQFVRGLDVIYSGLVANGAIRRIGKNGFELDNSQLLAQASAADRAKAAEVIRAIQTLSDLRSLPQAVAAITHEQYEITV
jgi:type I restriction enzyme, S subunit